MSETGVFVLTVVCSTSLGLAMSGLLIVAARILGTLLVGWKRVPRFVDPRDGEPDGV